MTAIDVCVVAINEVDAMDFCDQHPTLGELPWMTPNQYMRMKQRAPRQVYTTPSVKELESYQYFRAFCIDNLISGDES